MKKKIEFPLNVATPAQRALANAGIASLQQLSKFSEVEIASLHGMGPNAISKIKQALIEHGLTFITN